MISSILSKVGKWFLSWALSALRAWAAMMAKIRQADKEEHEKQKPIEDIVAQIYALEIEIEAKKEIGEPHEDLLKEIELLEDELRKAATRANTNPFG